MKGANQLRESADFTANQVASKTTTPAGSQTIATDEHLRRANNAYYASTTYIDSNYRKQWDDDINAFHSKHPAGSKYRSQAYKWRSTLYRPKTRTAVRKMEAAAVAAFFSSLDATLVEPANEYDPQQKMAADIKRETLQYRLAQPDMQWFQTVIGAVQDAAKLGVVCSFNYWKHRERVVKTGEEMVTDENGVPIKRNDDGKPVMRPIYERETLEDHPEVELVPVEQIRFHPGANWRDPINSSPYVVREIPMYIYEVQARATDEYDSRYQLKFFKCDKQEMVQAAIGFDSTRVARNEQKEDPSITVDNVTEFTQVWVREVIMRDVTGEHGGEDVIYYTLGDLKRISEVEPLSKVYPTNNRPVTLGRMILETHTSHSASLHKLGEGLQKEANAVVNDRLDNVRLAMRKGFLARRGGQVDVKSLVRNVAGGITFVSDVDRDVKQLEFNDVTRSSYEEQDRINVEHDDLIGSFSQSSVNTNRKLNETVGGMQMMHSGAGQMTDYGLRVFSETWLEPTLRQIADLQALYESDETIFQVVAGKLHIQDMDINGVADMLTDNRATVTIDVGIGASNPMFKLERFIGGVAKYVEVMVAAGRDPRLNDKEVAAEFFAYLGYKTPRFVSFPEDDAEGQQIAQLQQTIQQLQQALEDQAAAEQAKQEAQIHIAQIKEQGATERTEKDNEAKERLLAIENAAKLKAEEASADAQLRIEAAKQQMADRMKSREMVQKSRDERFKVAAQRLSAKDQAAATTAEGAANRDAAANEAKATREATASESQATREHESGESKATRDHESKAAETTAKQDQAAGEEGGTQVMAAIKEMSEANEKLVGELVEAQQKENEQREKLLAAIGVLAKARGVPEAAKKLD